MSKILYSGWRIHCKSELSIRYASHHAIARQNEAGCALLACRRPILHPGLQSIESLSIVTTDDPTGSAHASGQDRLGSGEQQIANKLNKLVTWSAGGYDRPVNILNANDLARS